MCCNWYYFLVCRIISRIPVVLVFFLVLIHLPATPIIIFDRSKMQHTIKKYNIMQKLITKKRKLKDNIKKKIVKTYVTAYF